MESCFSKKLQPSDGRELLSLLQKQLEPRIRDHTFLIALQGVKMVGVSDAKLGSMLVVDSAERHIERAKLPQPEKEIGWVWKALKGHACLVGTFRGTFDAARRKFSQQAHLTAGLLAVAAGYTYDRGATTFCSWGSGFGSHQQFEIDDARRQELTGAGVWNYAFHILGKTKMSDVEEAINRAVYWYGDAHRDPVAVMQFVKYWSCIECFFSLGDAEVTESLALGVSTVLTFGHFPLYERGNYAATRASVKSLYSKRSRAVHGASHEHVRAGDLVLLSQWAALVIVNMISFAHADLPTRRILFERLKRIDFDECARA